ncbi:MAG: hypothetical protein L6Q33_10130 [Bacteriovoracaceae bacterium]|nr:hypothetical protein [Bacteriovoracaceae bacterium]
MQEYLYSLGKVQYGFLCNGYEWKLYDFNDQKKIEFQKYIKTQQRLMKKNPKKVSKGSSGENTSCEVESISSKTDTAA